MRRNTANRLLHGLSGFKVSAEDQTRMHRLVSGEIALADMLKALHERYGA